MSRLKQNIRAAIEGRLKRPVYRAAPVGLRLQLDTAKWLPDLTMDVILDVGANIGGSAFEFRANWPSAHIHSFEPVGETFHALCAAMKHDPRFTAHRLALASSPRDGRMRTDGISVMHQLVDADAVLDAPLENVSVDTLDRFCKAQNLDRASFLKIDTEGNDLEVLRGAQAMLQGSRIDLIQVEAGMHPENERHVPFEVLKSYLEGYGYRLFAIYEQTMEWLQQRPHLRRTNPVFVSPTTIDRHASKGKPS